MAHWLRRHRLIAVAMVIVLGIGLRAHRAAGLREIRREAGTAVVSAIPANLNDLYLRVESGAGRAEAEVLYPGSVVVLAAEARSGQSVPFEQAFEPQESEITHPRAWSRLMPADASVPGVFAWSPGGYDQWHQFYGMFRGALYKCSSSALNRAGAQALLEIALAQCDTLAVSYLPRVRMQQLIDGAWISLGRFVEGSERWSAAPAETLVLRPRFDVMRVVFLKDRVEVLPARTWERRHLSAETRRPDIGTWHEALAGQMGPVDSLGGGQEWRVPLRPPFGSFEFVVTVAADAALRERLDGRLANWSRQFKVRMPGVCGEDPDPRYLSTWSEIPTLSEVRKGTEDPAGFPGRGPYPRWAYERCAKLGPPYWAPSPGTSNYRAYGPSPSAIEVYRMNHKDMLLTGRPGDADSYWREVMDYPGGDSLAIRPGKR